MRLPNVVGLALIASVGFNVRVARATGGEAGETADRQANDQASVELMEYHRHHHHGGVTQFIVMSLDTLGIDDTQRSRIEKTQSELQSCMAPSRGIETKLHLALAKGIAAGKIEKAKVDSRIAELGDAALAVHDCSVNALNELHAILSPMERSELVGKVQAHWEVWRRVNHEAPADGRERGGRLAELARELSLTPGQVNKMSAALRAAFADVGGKFDPDKAEAHVQAFAVAFVADSFDAKSIAVNSNGYLAGQGATRMSIFYETVTPILTRKQRATLAMHLRQHAANQPAISLN